MESPVSLPRRPLVDVVSPAVRSRMMAGIKGKNTRPERIVRSYLHRAGFRFALHRKDLPGRPDIVLPKYRTVVFVHGCFWHRHPGCRFATTPATRAVFWQEKFRSNVSRDRRNRTELRRSGWRIEVVWACTLCPARIETLVRQITGNRRSR